MASKTDKKKDEKPAPPSGGLSFIIGILLFSMIFCPGTVFIFYTMNLHWMLPVDQFQSLTLGCFAGIVVAVIPAIIFMRATMKRIKDY